MAVFSLGHGVVRIRRNTWIHMLGDEMNANELADELMKFYNLEENTAPIQIYDLAATMLRQQQSEIEALIMGDVQWSHAFDLAKLEIADLKAEIEALKKNLQESEEFAKAWILYATKIEMLMPTMWDSDSGREMGWSVEYLKGYNDAIREAREILRKANEK